jgi:proteasome accessory factor B
MSQEKFFEYARRLVLEEKRNRDSWAAELNITVRSVNNFNRRLANEFGIAVENNRRGENQYFINKSKSRRYEDFINYINNLNAPSIIAEAFVDTGEFGRHLIFHQNWNKIGWMKYFNEIVKAINDQHPIKIQCFNHRKEKTEIITLQPYWMKQNAYFRWYVIGFENEQATFPIIVGCDKILELTVEDSIFPRKKDLEAFRQEFENLLGVYLYPDKEAELVRIECTHFQAHYLKSMPLHGSQTIESENEEVTIFRYSLQINHEFAYELLRQNVWNFHTAVLKDAHPERTALKVLEPLWLVDYYRQTYKRAFLAYCDDPEIARILSKDVHDAPRPYPIPFF